MDQILKPPVLGSVLNKRVSLFKKYKVSKGANKKHPARSPKKRSGSFVVNSCICDIFEKETHTTKSGASI